MTPLPAAVVDHRSTTEQVRAIIDQWHRTGFADTRAALTHFPELQLDRSLVLELAYEEFIVRTSAGEPLDPNDFADQFPEFRSTLRSVLRAHQILEGGTDLSTFAPEFRWPEPGEELLGYRIDQPLGQGAFARVYRATHTVTGQPRVIKVAPADSREVRLMATLDHPNVAAVHDARRHGAMLVIVMPFHGSATLNDLLDVAFQSSNRVPPEQRIISAITRGARPDEIAQTRPCFNGLSGPYERAIAIIGAQIARGLEYLHAQRIWHRDLKPSNVVLAWDGRPVIVDFNLSVDASAATDRTGGTMPYMAPEHLLAVTERGPAQAVDSRSDLYSLGVVLYELLTGRHPFGIPPTRPVSKGKGGSSDFAEWLYEQQRLGPLPVRHLNPAVPSPFDRLVCRCLAFDPINRPRSAGEVAAALERIAAPSNRRWPKLLAACSALLVAPMAMGVWHSNQPQPIHLAASAFRTGDYPAAIRLWDQAAQHYPNDPSIYLLRGAARLRLNDPEEAVHDFRKAERLGLRDGRVLAALAYCEAEGGNHRVAIAHADEAVRRGDAPAAVWANRASSKLRLPSPDLEGAIRDAEEALSRDPSLLAAYAIHSIARYRLYLSRGRNEDDRRLALAATRQAIDRGSGSPVVRRYGAELLLQQPRPTRAECDLALRWLQEAAASDSTAAHSNGFLGRPRCAAVAIFAS